MVFTQLPNGVASPDLLAAYLQELIVEYESYKKQFRRVEDREPVSIPVEAIKLDENLEPCSEPFHMVTRDMSFCGVGMFHTEIVDADYVILRFSSPVSLEIINVLAKVEHCTPCGKYFIIGCHFVPDLLEELRN